VLIVHNIGSIFCSYYFHVMFLNCTSSIYHDNGVSQVHMKAAHVIYSCKSISVCHLLLYILMYMHLSVC